MLKDKRFKNKKTILLTEAPKIRRNDPEVLKLWVRAGGRCEFPGCNKYLLEDEFTGFEVSLEDMAHIVGRSRKGPRGENSLCIKDRNKVGNLMLLCSEHHNKIIDRTKLLSNFPPKKLLKHKKDHERRIYYLTSIQPGSETTIIRMRGKVRGDDVEIPVEQIRKAVFEYAGRYPRYSMSKNDIEIDLKNLPENDEIYWRAGVEIIDNVMERFYAPGIENAVIKHVSVFALSRIPFLIYFGSRLTDKIPTDIYQKHRGGEEGWIWMKNQRKINFKPIKLQTGKNNSNVAIILSVSGQIRIDNLPNNITDKFSIYEIVPDGVIPNRNILQLKSSLESFRNTYQLLLRKIEKTHKKTKSIHLFPAVPLSVAIVCGRELLKGISPSLRVYDVDKEKNFKFAMEVN